MVFIVKKKFGNNTYLYLCKNEWIKGKVKRTLNIYLGKEENLKDRLGHIQRTPSEITNLETSLLVILLHYGKLLNYLIFQTLLIKTLQRKNKDFPSVNISLSP